MKPQNCKSFKINIENGKYPNICSFVGTFPIICCPIITQDTQSAMPGKKKETGFSGVWQQKSPSAFRLMGLYSQ